jgi:peptide/nickel transport system permease protein
VSILTALWRSPTGRIGLLLTLLVVAFSLVGPLLLQHPPQRIAVLSRFQPPSFAHFLGTDHLGRDLASRLAHGGRVALLVACATIALALVTGTLLGILAGFAPPRIAGGILVMFDIIASFPSLVFALAVVALLGPGLDRVVLIVAITLIPHFGRVARAQTLSVRATPYIEAERALGASFPRIILVHVVPNIMGPLVVLASMDIPVVITIEAGLSFLGVGVPPPRASWGALLYDGYTTIGQSAWPVAMAALMLTLATLGFTLFGEALRDAIDPRIAPAP